jgi:hypothetical protein
MASNDKRDATAVPEAMQNSLTTTVQKRKEHVSHEPEPKRVKEDHIV